MTEGRPRWLAPKEDPAPAENHHVWAPRPVGRSILWTPVGEHRNAPAGPYEVFVKQRALEAMHRHLWSADLADEPFGYLFGYLCEDRESQRRYVIISDAVASAYPLYENESEQISPESVRALRREASKHDGVVAGWYRRHREGPVRLSDEDEATHREHFGEPWQVAFLMVTDPNQPAGGCLQPRTHGVTAHAPLPFYELANAASLLARGIRRTRIDWENVKTDTHVLVEPLPRAEKRPTAPEPIAAEVAETESVSADPPDAEVADVVYELDHLTPPPALDLAPESEAHFELLVEAEAESPDDLAVPVEPLETEVVEAVEAEPTRESAPAAALVIKPLTRPERETDSAAEAEPEVAVEPEDEPLAAVEPAEVDPESEIEAEPVEPELTEPLGVLEAEPEPTEPQLEAEPEAEYEPATEPEKVEAETKELEPEAEAEAQPAGEFMVAQPAVVEWLDPAPNLRPQPAPPPLEEVVPRPEPAVSAEPEVSPAPEPEPEPEKRRQRSPHWNGTIEGLLVLIAVGSIVVGAWPLPGGSRAATEDLPSFATALAGFVWPAAVPSSGLEAFDESDPLAPAGREVRAAVGRFNAVSDMFVARRLTCEPLREAYVEVNASWSAYSGAIARSGGERSEGETRRDEAVAREVQEAETSFTSSGCERP